MTEVRLSAVSLEELGRRSADGYPYESCGLVLGRETGRSLEVTRVFPAANVAPAAVRRRRFVIDPRLVLNVQRELRGTAESILGFYHSHPDAEAEPSPTDMRYFRLWPETVWLIVPVLGGAAGSPRAWWLDDPDARAPRELAVSALSGGEESIAGAAANTAAWSVKE